MTQIFKFNQMFNIHTNSLEACVLLYTQFTVTTSTGKRVTVRHSRRHNIHQIVERMTSKTEIDGFDAKPKFECCAAMMMSEADES